MFTFNLCQPHGGNNSILSQSVEFIASSTPTCWNQQHYFNLVILSGWLKFSKGDVFAGWNCFCYHCIPLCSLTRRANLPQRLLRLHSAATLTTDSTPVNRVPSASRQEVTRMEVCLREPLLDD